MALAYTCICPNPCFQLLWVNLEEVVPLLKVTFLGVPGRLTLHYRSGNSRFRIRRANQELATEGFYFVFQTGDRL